MNMEEAALIELVSVAVQVAKVADFRADQAVLVFGYGPMGVLCQAVAKAYGAKKVIGVDVVKSRLGFAKTLGDTRRIEHRYLLPSDRCVP